jgi:hypothetical protein
VLADKIQTFWTNFAKTGDPNEGGSAPRHHPSQSHGTSRDPELPVWPAYSSATGHPQLMALDHVCAATPVVRAPMLDIHDVWLRRACGEVASVAAAVAKL